MNPGEELANVKNIRSVLLDPDEEKRRVVLKRIKRDNLGVRADFLKTGTMAQGIHARMKSC